ncbi:MAG TPA: phosphomevalonate kinase [Pseudogracilibacillus sp.]|nr:phosphomevalonate kinase [Pseudogracilibacillus sp.]
MKEKLVVKTPGKLMVAGEFAVLEKGYPLLVMAVDRYVHTVIEDATSYRFTSENFKLYDLTWHFNGERVIFENYSPRLKFVTSAMTTVLTYLKEKGVETTPFSLSVRSELDDEETGAKYGLGSSAAVVTSVVAAILEKFLQYPPARSLIFKLAAIAHVRTQGSGSGADIAASTYGGVIYYKSFQANWLLYELRNSKDILPVIQKKWRYLQIKEFQFPKNTHLCIGWTGKPASTKSLVSEISKLKKTNRSAYDSFLQNSRRAVNLIVQGINQDDEATFFKGITNNRHTLAKLGAVANVPIETEKLALLSELAEQVNGVGKLSGAGGGDCGIAFLQKEADRTRLYERWEDNGIQPLALTIDKAGTIVTDRFSSE